MKSIANSVKLGILIILLFVITSHSFAQSSNLFITNYTLPVEMSAQNYGLVQDDNDVIYVLNQNGVYNFDGYSWERLPIPGQPIAMDFIDNLFVGGDQELGYFKRNLKGIITYTSVGENNTELFYLFHHVNKNLYVVGIDGVYKVRRVEPYKIEPYYTEKDSGKIVTDLFDIDPKLFIVKNKKAIYQLAKQSATEIPVSLAKNEEFVFSFRHNGYQVFGTNLNKLYRFDGSKLTPIAIKDQGYLDECFVTGGISIDNSTIAISTLIGGCIVVNTTNGTTKNIINYDNGLPDDEVTAMGKDRQGGLWLIHGMGISRVDLSIPMGSYQQYDGLSGNLLSVAKLNADLYVGTSEGLFRLGEQRTYKAVHVERRHHEDNEKQSEVEEQPKIEKQQSADSSLQQRHRKGLFTRLFGRNKSEVATTTTVTASTGETKTATSHKPRTNRRRVYQLVSTKLGYEKIPSINGKINQLTKWNNGLFVVSSTGFYYMSDAGSVCIIPNTYIYSMYCSTDKKTVYVGASGELFAVKNDAGKWKVKTIESFPKERIMSITEVSDGNLMITTDNKVFNINREGEKYVTKQVSTGAYSIVSPVIRNTGSTILVITPNQIFDYVASGDSLSISSAFPKQSSYKAFYNNASYTWIRDGQAWSAYPDNSSTSRFKKYLGLLDRVNYVGYADSTEVWVVNNYAQIYKLYPNQANDTIKKIDLYLKQIIDKAGRSLNTRYVKLEASNNAFRIELEAPFYLKEKGVEYQYKLVDIMSDWTDWGDTPEKDFPFFPPGDHILQFRARDAMGNISPIHQYEFSITPPFYQTIWFYILVIAFLIAVIVLTIRLREQKLRKEKEILEQKVKERTKTIEEQKHALEEQRDELKIRNEEILQQKEEIEAQRDEITAQRDQIISQNQDIIKSISYARRIQTAVMPSKNRTDSILNNYFILLKPRDIVSGDFYWMTKRNNKIIVTAADCTGHGVPGAFMSLLGITLLDEIVNSADELLPHLILNSLRAHLKRALSQVGKEHEAKDGMDIALSVIDINTNKLLFAGAYNPLYVVRNSQLLEFKADKMPVGVHINEKESFTLHEIQLEKNDCLYMFSDGYVDQFGGDDNRKFMTKNFKELLVNISTKEMDEQRTILDDTIDKWMGAHDQVDDILVMGIRI